MTDTNDRLLLSTKDAENNITTYGYDVNDRLVSVSAANGTQTAAVSYEYTDDRLTGISRNGTEYEFDYDEFGNRICTKAGGAALVSSEYRPHNGLLEKQTYGNGYEHRNEYNKKEQLIAQHGKEYGKTEQQLFKNMYDDNGSLISHSDMENELRTDFQYDMIGRMTGSEKYSTKTDGSKDRKDMSQRVSYDDKNRVSEYVQKLEGESAIRTGYRYGDPSKGEDPGLIYSITEGNVEKITYVYDDLGRVTKKILNPGTSMERVTEYTYVDGAKTGTTTLLVETVKENGFQYHYIYDKRGNITRIRKSNSQGTEVYTNYYMYDALGQIIQEDNGEIGKRVIYTYDAGGNITRRKIYPYGSGVAGSLADTKNYVYSSALSNSTSGINANWKDLLISYGDEQSSYIRYDEIGNARTYRGRVLSWKKGKNLDNISGTNLNISFKYDQNGVRISKESTGKSVKYHMDGSRIMALEYNNHLVQFMYDPDGTPFGLRYKQYGSEVLLDYYYVHNMFGDVMGLVDSNGNQVVTYQYDSWGVPVSVTDNSGCNLSVLNPFRYRGYVYDDETGYYYLKSRYYDPESGRFLSADNVMAGAGGSVKGYNMYEYCYNNPVGSVDGDGYWPKRIKRPNKKKGKKSGGKIRQMFSRLRNTIRTLKSAIRSFTKEQVGFSVEKEEEEVDSITKWGFVTHETGKGYNVKADFEKTVNSYVIVEDSLRDSAVGICYDFERFGSGVEIGINYSTYIYMGNTTFEYGENLFGNVYFQFEQEANGVYIYNKYTINKFKTAMIAVGCVNCWSGVKTGVTAVSEIIKSLSLTY